VVIGLDGSETSWDAFWWACGETRRLRGRAIVVFVTSAVHRITVTAIPGVPICDYAAIEDAAAAQAAQLGDEAQRSPAGHGLNLSFVHARGDPAIELLQVATTVQADLIVVGRSTKIRHRFTGALGQRLVSKRNAPVVVIVP
jgi:nucleotide-binding universal stress UspA family protein